VDECKPLDSGQRHRGGQGGGSGGSDGECTGCRRHRRRSRRLNRRAAAGRAHEARRALPRRRHRRRLRCPSIRARHLRQGLTLIHFSAQLKPCLIHTKHPTHPKYPLIPPYHGLHIPYAHPLSHENAQVELRSERVSAPDLRRRARTKRRPLRILPLPRVGLGPHAACARGGPPG